jgi:hypothetical protein
MSEPILINIGFNISNPLHDLIVNTSLDIRDRYGSDWYVDDNKYQIKRILKSYQISIYKNVKE